MPRRVSLPGADELFGGRPEPSRASSGHLRGRGRPRGRIRRRVTTPSGRVRHDEKITVYVTADELLDPRAHPADAACASTALAVDRGRIVREAIHLALAGRRRPRRRAAPLVRRLREQ